VLPWTNTLAYCDKSIGDNEKNYYMNGWSSHCHTTATKVLTRLGWQAGDLIATKKGLTCLYGREALLPITSSLNYKPMTIVNDDSRVVTKLETSLTDDARVVIYDCHMFVVHATVCAEFSTSVVND
jgi:hypothetical protein